MMNANNKLSGLYLVVDPGIGYDKLFPKLRESLEAGVNVLQLWNHWPARWTNSDRLALIHEVLELTSSFNVPVLINEEWQLLKQCSLDGIHFDTVPNHLDRIKEEIGRDFIVGLTCGNDLKSIQWAEEHELDYISFCSMFPSSSVQTCEIVRPESILEARKITSMPIFLSGGIHPGHIAQLGYLHFQGVAVISGIMNSDSITERVGAYKMALKDLKIMKG